MTVNQGIGALDGSTVGRLSRRTTSLLLPEIRATGSRPVTTPRESICGYSECGWNRADFVNQRPSCRIFAA